jgi:hypothetical protein
VDLKAAHHDGLAGGDGPVRNQFAMHGRGESGATRSASSTLTSPTRYRKAKSLASTPAALLNLMMSCEAPLL